MQLAPEIIICRLLILYAILHIVVLIKDIYKYKTSVWNIKARRALRSLWQATEKKIGEKKSILERFSRAFFGKCRTF